MRGYGHGPYFGENNPIRFDETPSRVECRKCKGNGLVSGENEDGVFFDVCSKCNGLGYSSDSARSQSEGSRDLGEREEAPRGPQQK